MFNIRSVFGFATEANIDQEQFFWQTNPGLLGHLGKGGF